jgi:hypothetical protein
LNCDPVGVFKNAVVVCEKRWTLTSREVRVDELVARVRAEVEHEDLSKA